jgi:hypothetical protein
MEKYNSSIFSMTERSSLICQVYYGGVNWHSSNTSMVNHVCQSSLCAQLWLTHNSSVGRSYLVGFADRRLTYGEHIECRKLHYYTRTFRSRVVTHVAVQFRPW